MEYMIVSYVCRDCGGDATAKLFDHMPTNEELSEYEDEFKPGRCGSVQVLKKQESGAFEKVYPPTLV